MQHNMSYRKPVPVYVPSPPPATQELPELLDVLNQVEKDVSLVSQVWLLLCCTSSHLLGRVVE